MKNQEKHTAIGTSCFFLLFLLSLLTAACDSNKAAQSTSPVTTDAPVGPTFSADSAYLFCRQQCDFGPRTMNSSAHDECEQWIAGKFKQYGCSVCLQKTNLTAYDGTTLHATNIIASLQPEQTERIIICAHWDSRPWADNDEDPALWHQPVMAANDGASGVAVMIELARLMQQDSLPVGIDFICFDAEDYGPPQWSDYDGNDNTWALGSQHWAANPHSRGYTARYGILLDMVGGQGARFFKEGFSMNYAEKTVDKVWKAAAVVGFRSIFCNKRGATVTDDHLPMNEIAGIPTIDIIAHYPDCPQSSFGPTWHTSHDTMDNIDPDILKAVGQTLIQVVYSEE